MAISQEVINILGGIGIGAIICILAFYFKVKSLIQNDMVNPLLEPLKKDIMKLQKDFQEEVEKRDKHIEKIDSNLEKLMLTMQKLESVFDIIKNRIEIKIKN